MRHSIFILLVFAAIGLNAQQNISTANWIVRSDVKQGGDQKVDERYSFKKDGSFIFTAGEVTITGIWKWVDKNEIFVEQKGIDVGGKVNPFDKPVRTYIRIVEMTDNAMVTNERGETDTWDGGFARQRRYEKAG